MGLQLNSTLVPSSPTGSRLLQEANYNGGNRKLLSIKEALEKSLYCLEGAKYPCQDLTDHNNLEYLKTTKQLNPCQAHHAVFYFFI